MQLCKSELNVSSMLWFIDCTILLCLFFSFLLRKRGKKGLIKKISINTAYLIFLLKADSLLNSLCTLFIFLSSVFV